MSFKFKILSVFESPHFPVALEIKHYTVDGLQDTGHTGGKWVEKLIWDTNKESTFIDIFNSDELQTRVKCAVEAINFDSDESISLFVSAVLQAGECMIKRFKTGTQTKCREAEWFDEECMQSKTKTRHLLNTYRKKSRWSE